MTPCSHCRFWQPYSIDPAGDGECRRHAPLATLRSSLPEADRNGLVYRQYAYWPVTHATDGCGEALPTEQTGESAAERYAREYREAAPLPLVEAGG